MAIGQVVVIAKAAYQFLDDTGLKEVALREVEKKISDLLVFAVNKVPDGDAKEILNNVIGNANKNNDSSQVNELKEENASQIQKLNLVFGAANLYATCAGFAAISDKLDKLGEQVNQINGTILQGYDLNVYKDLRGILNEHVNMLDARKTKRYYSEEQMRKLVDDEFTVLGSLIESFVKNYTADTGRLISSIYATASMMTVSIRYFDELYYQNNKKLFEQGAGWHYSHDGWIDALETIVSDEFIAKIQDYGVFERRLSLTEVDIYYRNLVDQVKNMEESIANNQKLIMELESPERIEAYEECVNRDVAENIKDAFAQTEGALDNTEVANIYQDIMKQLELPA